MRENVEVVDWPALWLVPVQLPGEVDFPRVLIDEESSIICKLTCQTVADLGLPVQVGISGSDLRLDRNLERLGGESTNHRNELAIQKYILHSISS